SSELTHSQLTYKTHIRSLKKAFGQISLALRMTEKTMQIKEKETEVKATTKEARRHPKVGKLIIPAVVVNNLLEESYLKPRPVSRSKDHTSELQSRENLVC